MPSLRPFVIAVAVGAAFVSATACVDLSGPVIDFGKDCTTDSDCTDWHPFAILQDERCQESYCYAKRCDVRARASYDAVPGDCQRTLCSQDDGGIYASAATSSSDVPPSTECSVGICVGGYPSHEPAADGTPCSVGVCKNAVCTPVGPEDAGADAADAN